MSKESSIVILGAGLQGCAIALELAHRGHSTILLDQDALPMNRASLRNEGKIHLGLIWANDATFQSAELQLRGALTFHALLRRWCGDAADAIPQSTPFDYIVANDSVMAADQLTSHYERVQDAYRKALAADPALNYLGHRPERLYAQRENCEAAKHFDMGRIAAVFETAELAVDTEAMADTVRAAVLHSDKIRFLPARRVAEIHRTYSGFRIVGSGAAGTWSLDTEQVVNATWEGRFALDRSIGLELQPGWLHRLKYRVIVQLPTALRDGPSATMVLGRYGDVVVRPNGTAYLSWYPTGMRGWTHDIAPPSEWDAACRGEPNPLVARDVAQKALQNIEAWYPGIGQSVPVTIDAGAIVAYGKTDVDDSQSGLHHRTRVGVTSVDGYHSVDPGKLTTAPLFAIEAADAIVGMTGRVSGPTNPCAKPASTPPRVVALMPTWNAETFLEPVLQSVLAQTYPNLTVLISDDCSTDSTADICARYAASDARIVFIRQPKNLGWIGNVNALLNQAEGDLFFFAFHDDVLSPEYVASLAQAMEDRPEVIIAFSDMEVTNIAGRVTVCAFGELDGIADPVARAREIISCKGHWWVPNRGLFRARAADEIGGLKRHGRGEFSADWPWLLHMSLLGQFVRVPRTLCFKRYLPTSVSRAWRRNIIVWFFVALSASREVRSSPLPALDKARLHLSLAGYLIARVVDAFARRLRKLIPSLGGLTRGSLLPLLGRRKRVE